MPTRTNAPHHATARRHPVTVTKGVMIVLLAFGLGFVATPATSGMATVVAGVSGR